MARLNETTRGSLALLRDYWGNLAAEQPIPPHVIEQLEVCNELLADGTIPLDDEQLGRYFELLTGPAGCDFTEADGQWSWTCGGGTDKSKSARILADDFELDAPQVERMHRLVDALGGHCDCEIVMNAQERMVQVGTVVGQGFA